MSNILYETAKTLRGVIPLNMFNEVDTEYIVKKYVIANDYEKSLIFAEIYNRFVNMADKLIPYALNDNRNDIYTDSLLISISKFNSNKSKFSTLIYTVISNTTKNFYKHLNRDCRYVDNLSTSYQQMVDNGFDLPDENNEFDVLIDLKKKMSEKTYNVAKLLSQGYNASEIANILDVTPQAIYGIKQTIKKILIKENYAY